MPHSTSKSKLDMVELYHKATPSLRNMKDIDAALQVWGQYWKVLNENSGLKHYEKEVRRRMENYLRVIVGDFNSTKYDYENNLYSKTESSELVVKFYKYLQSLSNPEHFPIVQNVKKNGENWNITLKSWVKAPEKGLHYLKFTLYPGKKDVLERDSDSETSTEMENPIFLEYFTIKGGLIIDDEDGELYFMYLNFLKF